MQLVPSVEASRMLRSHVAVLLPLVYWMLWTLLICRTIAATTTTASKLRGGSDEKQSAQPPPPPPIWPVHRKLVLAQNGTLDTNQWIIIFRSRNRIFPQLFDRNKIVYQFNKVLNAVVVSGLAVKTLEGLLRQDDILIIEQDQPVFSLATITTQTLKDGQPWGIDRVDGAKNGKYTYSRTGRGVSVYIFDTGIQSNHDEFIGGRVSCGINLIASEDCEDGKGHGTHVAGTVGGKTYGLAKNVNFITVKVLDANGAGTSAGVIKGLEYVLEQKISRPAAPMIVNLSLGSSGKSDALNEAVNRAVAAGLVVITAAGNESVDACTTSPASAGSALTIGGMNIDDMRPNWSNYGPCVNMHAPASDILSAYVDKMDKKKSSIQSGTSVAVPHAAGVAAMYLEWDPTLTPDKVYALLKKDAASNALSNLLNSPNLLLSSAAIQTYAALTTAPVPAPSVLLPPNLFSRPTTGLGVPEPAAKCGAVVVSPCVTDADCCLKACRDFGKILGITIDKRCFFF